MRPKTAAVLVVGLAAMLASPATQGAATQGTATQGTKKAASARGKTAKTLARKPTGPAQAKKSARSGHASTTSAKKQRPRNAPVELFHVNRRDRMFLRLVDKAGRPERRVDKQARWFFRCHHTNKQHRIDSRLIRLIYNVGRHYNGKRLEIVAGYRHPSAASRNPKTYHKDGKACDFRVRGVTNADLRDYVRTNFKNVGVGYYPNSSFVHLDVRDARSAFWIDYSAPGQSASYSEDPMGDLQSGRADNAQTRIDPTWAGIGAGAPKGETEKSGGDLAAR